MDSLFYMGQSILFLLLFVQDTRAINSILRKKYENYGEDWIFMPNGSGQPQVAVLKEFNFKEFEGFLMDESITYILYTRLNPEQGTGLFINDTETLKTSNFESSKPTKFITHGWKSNVFTASILAMKNEYLKKGDYNVILVNWEPLAASTFYLGPMKNTAKVGRNAGEFIEFLVRETHLNIKDVHFIGHSLGAHVAGNTGESVMGTLGRITGLDPALPGFHLLSSEKGRLDPSDADLVDVIHSCGGVLGFLQPLGDVDFYPNAGAAMQPGCCCVPELIEACSHGRAYEYFTESINSKIGFRAKKCENWDKFNSGECDNNEVTFLGEYVDYRAKGSFFLKTKSRQPYAYDKDMVNDY